METETANVISCKLFSGLRKTIASLPHPKTIKTKVILAALLWLIVINPGSIAIIDTAIRMQMAHAWWTGEEEVLPGTQLAIEVRGKNLVPYDLGQSILMLPADYVGTQLGQWLPTEKLRQNFREVMVSFLVFLPLNLALIVCVFQFLKLFGFEEKQAGAASLAWLLGTTVLHYAAVHQQNNQVLLFVLIGYQTALASVLRQQRKWAVLSGMSLGMAYLIRLTGIVHGCSVLLFLLGCVAYKSRSTPQVFKFLESWLAGFIPVFLLERGLTYLRYGSFFATSASLHLQALSHQEIPATALSIVRANPKKFPFWEMLSHPKLTAILGPLFSIEKSIFIYDPLLLPGLVTAFLFWKRLLPYLKWYIVVVILDFVTHLLLYSWTFNWQGDSAWGARYHLTSIHLLLVPLVCLLMQWILVSQKVTLYRAVWFWLARLVFIVAVCIQLSSVALSYNLEIAQQELGVGSRFRLIQRLSNISLLLTHGTDDSEPTELKILDQTLDKSERGWTFLPFKFTQKLQSNPFLSQYLPLTFIFWDSVLILAIGATIFLIRAVM